MVSNKMIKHIIIKLKGVSKEQEVFNKLKTFLGEQFREFELAVSGKKETLRYSSKDNESS